MLSLDLLARNRSRDITNHTTIKKRKKEKKTTTKKGKKDGYCN